MTGVQTCALPILAGKAAQNIMLPVSQKMDVLAGTPEVYGTPSKDKIGRASCRERV